MVDIQSATAEIRRGKKRRRKKEEKKKEAGQNIMSAYATQGGHKKKQGIRSLGDHHYTPKI